MRPRKILVIGAEPGSGSTLGPVVGKIREEVAICCSSRAAGVFREFGLDVVVIPDPSNADDGNRILSELIEEHAPHTLVSTLLGHPETSLDRAAARVCSTRSIRHVAVLDSWMNLASRFDVSDGQFCHVPSLIAVPDEQTRLELIALGLPEASIAVTGHPFFDEIRQVPRRNGNGKKRIGFLLQPLASLVEEGFESPGYDEETATTLFFKGLDLLEWPADKIEVVFKEHPRRKSRYHVPADFRYTVGVAEDLQGGWEFLQKCDVVVGMSSTLLVHSFLAEIPTIVIQPFHNACDDPNILTSRGIVKNALTAHDVWQELTLALNDDAYQFDAATVHARSQFQFDGKISKRIAEFIDDISGRPKSQRN